MTKHQISRKINYRNWLEYEKATVEDKGFKQYAEREIKRLTREIDEYLEGNSGLII